MDETRLHLITSYFCMGMKQGEILQILSQRNGISLSRRQLQNILYNRNLYRNRNWTDIMTVVEFIIGENILSGGLHGYRWMYEKLKQNGLKARKEEVRLLMGVLDPEGVFLRQQHRLRRRVYQSRGPNYIWHLDSYDKLKPFGICINGCIDGYSRKIIWLNAYSSSSDPRIIGGYYLEAVEKGGCPRIVRSDRGTENGHVCEFQRFFRRHGMDQMAGERSFMYGTSTHNQRIECWWGVLRRQCAEFWMAFFDQIKVNGNFDGGVLDKNLIIFCFLALLQDELDSVAKVWENHIIRPTRNQHVPSGRPIIMFAAPELYNVQEYKTIIDNDQIRICKEEALFRKVVPCDEDIYDMCMLLMVENNLQYPTDAYKALDLYLDLREKILEILQ